MSGSYDDRDGKIWMNGKLIEWRDANVHILTHAMHYASSVFEGERAYNGKIFKSEEHTQRFFDGAQTMDMKIPFTQSEILNAKKELIICPTDYPFLYNQNESTRIFLGDKKHWRQIDQTLCTFLTSKKIINKY